MFSMSFIKKVATTYFLVLYNTIMESQKSEQHLQNEKDFDKLLLKRIDLEDFEKNGCTGRIHGWRDSYNNHYMIYKQRQKDGKFHGYIKNHRTGKRQKFVRKQKKAIRNLFFKRIYKANDKYNEVAKARQDRKEQLEALKPKLTVKEKQAQHCQKQMERLSANVTRNVSKMRRANTRIKTDKAKIKYYLRRLDKL